MQGQMEEQKGTDGPQKEAWMSYESVFTNNKAGMDHVDKNLVKKIVYEASKDSPHYKNEQRKEKQALERLEQLKLKAKKLHANELKAFQIQANRDIVQLETARDLSRTWMHVDMDMFYAAVEILDNPELAKIPMAVGGMGMISTANYEARKYGVRSAMPGFIAVKLCPHLRFTPPNFKQYTKKAQEVRQVLAQYDPNFISGGLDESYLDVTDFLSRSGSSAEQLAVKIRDQVFSETKLTCSIGSAANRMLAKISSDINKPNGQFILANKREDIMNFMSNLSIRKIPGIGKMTEMQLKGLGISTASDILEHAGLLKALFSNIATDFFLRSASGIGSSAEVEKETEDGISRKGISCERTFGRLSGKDLERKLKDIADTLSKQMVEQNLKAKHLTLKMKNLSFQVTTRCKVMSHYTEKSEDIFQVGLKLLRAERPEPLRLIGIRMSSFDQKGYTGVPGQMQIDFLLNKDSSKGKIQEQDAEKENASMLCARCGKEILPEHKLEHDDWHLAQDMHQKEVAIFRLPDSRKQSKAKPVNKISGMKTIDSIFKTRRTS